VKKEDQQSPRKGKGGKKKELGATAARKGTEVSKVDETSRFYRNDRRGWIGKEEDRAVNRIQRGD